MFQKMIAAILAIALIATMWAVPSQASSFSDESCFNVDFNSGEIDAAKPYTNRVNAATSSPTPTPKPLPKPFFEVDFSTSTGLDLTGNFTASEKAFKEVCKIQKDQELNRNVGVFNGKGGIPYYFNTRIEYDYGRIDITELPDYFIAHVANITLEAYVNLSDVQKDMTFLEVMGEGLNLQQYNNDSNACVGFSAGNAYRVNDVYTAQGGILPPGQWVHLIGTTDGETNEFYINGQLVASVDREDYWLILHEASNKLMLGDSFKGDSVFRGKIAFVKFYRGSVDDAGAAELYRAASDPDKTPPLTPRPTLKPTPSPTVAPPLSKLFEVDFSTGTGADTTDNFDIDQDGFDRVCTIQRDHDLKTNVGVFNGDGGIPYTSKRNLVEVLEDGYVTLEAYVNLDDVQKDMVFFETARSALHLKQYNDSSNAYVGFRGGDSIDYTDICDIDYGDAYYTRRNAYTKQGQILPSGRWVHLVGTCDRRTNRFYIDGQLSAAIDRESLLRIPHSFDEGPLSVYELMLGASLMEDSEFQGKIAFARIYKGSVDDAGAKALFYSAINSEVPSPEPLQVTYTSGKTNGKTADAVPLNETFSIEVYAIPTDCGYLVYNGRLPFYVGGKYLSIWQVAYWPRDFKFEAEVKIGEPVHLVLTGSGVTLKLYVNGVYNNSSACSRIVIGNKNFNLGKSMQLGSVAGDEYVFNVYNREATAEEVAAMYEPYKPAPKREGDIILQSKPSKMYYAIGEELDLTGLKVATKMDGITTPIAVEDCEITGFDSSVAGDVRISVKYETADAIFTNSFTLKILPKPSVIGIGLVTKPVKLYYNVGEELDITGLSILAKNPDGSTEYVSEGLEVTGYDSAVIGNQVVTVTYEGQTTRFTVSTRSVNVIGIGLQTKPGKLTYQYGEELDTTGLTILAKYSDGTIAYGLSEGMEVTGYDPKVFGNQRLTVTYHGQSTGFTIRVLNI